MLFFLDRLDATDRSVPGIEDFQYIRFDRLDAVNRVPLFDFAQVLGVGISGLDSVRDGPGPRLKEEGFVTVLVLHLEVDASRRDPRILDDPEGIRERPSGSRL